MSPKITETKKEQRKQAIAELSLQAFKEYGYHGTSMSMIAKYTDMSKGGLYAYFDSKEDLFIYILKFILDQKEYVLNPLQENETAYNQLLNQWERIIFSWDNLDVLSSKLMFEFWMESSKSSEYRNELVNNYVTTEKYFLDIIKFGKTNGEIVKDADPVLLSQIFWSYVDGQVQFWISRGKQPSKEELQNVFSQIKLLIKGIFVYE